jgi:glutathione S-transferase
MTTPTLVIGDYGLSSWSLRPWLALKAAAIPFQTWLVRLQQPASRDAILALSPSGKVPALIHGNLAICDSLAICEYAAELKPSARLWPEDAALRAIARSTCAEMHSGFFNLRTQMSFGLGTGDRVDAVLPETQWEIERIHAIWRGLLKRSGSCTFLCGDFGIVDAMFAPVVFRFRRFGVGIPADLVVYTQGIIDFPPMQEWMALAAADQGI